MYFLLAAADGELLEWGSVDAGVDLGSENIKITVVGGKLDIGRS